MSCKKVCVILQPTFLPWLGWFDLVDQADVMVMLDDVSFSKQSWQQRNRIRTRNGLEYLTVPVKTSGRFGQRIMDCELTNPLFVKKMISTLKMNYSKSAYYAGNIDELVSILEAGAGSGLLVELNCALIAWMAGKLSISTPIMRANTLNVDGDRGEHVAGICERVDADCYLSPVGAEAYLIEDKRIFDDKNIRIFLHVYEHPQYPQCFEPFIPFASAVDLIMNAGPMAPEVMRSGRRASRMIGECQQAESSMQSNGGAV